MQPCSASFQPTFDGAPRPTKLPSRLFQAAALQAADDHRQPVHSRQALELLVNNHDQFAAGELGQGIGMRVRRTRAQRQSIASLASPSGPRFQSHTARDPMQPTRQGLPWMYCLGFASKDQEHRLERIFRIMEVSQDALTNVQYHGPMTVNERGESPLVFRRNEPAQKGRIAFRFRRNDQPADVLE
jgi:hypothetical protein